MAKTFQANEIELVIKITKYCNLRCSYCYEFPFLGNKEMIPLHDLERLFQNVSSFRPTEKGKKDTFSFIWHGGEPFMVKMSYYEQIGAIQEAILADQLPYHNSVQTNLTILTQDHINDLKTGKFFNDVGFSFDVYGDQRVDILGRSVTDRVLNNLQRLRNHGISVGAITVLSRSTLSKIKNIYGFYEGLRMGIRILPYHIETLRHQTETNGLRPDEIAFGFCEIFDLWMQSERPISVQPLEIYIENAVAHINEKSTHYFDRAIHESIFITNLNGETTGYLNYMGDEPYGNLFEQTFEEILNSENRMKVAARSAERVEKYCTKCKYFGSCTGYPVAEANPMEERWLETNGCYVAMIIAHIVDRLDRAGLGGVRPTPAHHPAATLGL
jgi:uncharacterized protein